MIVGSILLGLAKDQISQNYSILRRQNAQRVQSELCANDVDSESRAIYQLRFIAPHEYVLEVICFSKPLEGVEVSRHKLPLWVTRSGGSVGVTADQPAEPMQLAVFADLIQILPDSLQSKMVWLVSHKTLIFEDNQVVSQKTKTILPVWTNQGVRSNCQAFNYSCCDEQNQAGQGPLVADTIDCPGRCYLRCLVRPIVISFGADGGFDPVNRSVEISGGGELNFSYVGQAGSVPLQSAVIDFGDGQNMTLDADTNSATHLYDCTQPVCQYDATITLVDVQNLTSPPTVLTGLRVVVRQ